MTHDKRINSKYLENGVIVSPAVPAKGETAKVVYKGLLAQSGAEKVYIHVGFGEDWRKSNDYKMIKTGEGFEVSVPIAIANTMNMCFKDNANNWDNNSGENYSYSVL